MQTFLGLGSNVGDRRRNLALGITELERTGVEIRRISPVVESAALLPADAPSEWNQPFLNLVLDCDSPMSAESLRVEIKRIELALGRDSAHHWSPRPLDIDILLWGREQITSATLTIPHPQTHTRSFVLAPLIALEPRLRLPGAADSSLLDWSQRAESHIPLWMGIVNLTPDSFSDGGRFSTWPAVEAQVVQMIEAGVHIVDLGAESTRPGATPIDADEEWRRLEPILSQLDSFLASDRLRPLVSIDTYHPQTVRRALERGVDIINDVTGLSNPAMLELASEGGADWVAMHSLSVPVVRHETLAPNENAVTAVDDWLEGQLERWQAAGVDLNRVIFDPGIGFGKTPLQSLNLLRAAGTFRRHGLRVLVGHSRKSFLGKLTSAAPGDRDVATVGASLALCAQGVDILRVHNVPIHAEAYRGWSHIVPDRGAD